MFTLLVLLSQLPVITFAFPHLTSPEESRHAGEEVFISKEEANWFIRRHLLYNRFDLELFTPGDLERECREELCNYEEAREIFVDEDKTMTFWQDYSIKGPITITDGNREKIDVMGLLTGLIAAGVFLVIFGLLGYYLCITKCNRQGHPGKSSLPLLQRSYRGAGQVRISPQTPFTEQDCRVRDLSGRQQWIRVLPTFISPASLRPSPLLGAETPAKPAKRSSIAIDQTTSSICKIDQVCFLKFCSLECDTSLSFSDTYGFQRSRLKCNSSDPFAISLEGKTGNRESSQR